MDKKAAIFWGITIAISGLSNSLYAADFLVNTVSGKCIDVSGAPGTSNGAQLQLWDCERSGKNHNGSPSDQLWDFFNGFIKNRASGKCIDVHGAPGTGNGAKLQLWDCELSGKHSNGSQTDQQWRRYP
jgi:hypothetical protein